MKILAVTNNNSQKSQNQKLGFKMLKVENITDAVGVFQSHAMIESILGQKVHSVASAIKIMGEKGKHVDSKGLYDDTFIFQEELATLAEGDVAKDFKDAALAKISLSELKTLYKNFYDAKDSERTSIVSQARNLFGLG